MTVVEDRPAASVGAATEFQAARRAMIDSQLRVSGVNTPGVLAAFAAVAREDFVPAERRTVAYADRAVPLADGTVLAPALTHGQMLEAAAPTGTDSVLVIATNGYLAALTGQLAGNVTSAASATQAQDGPFSLILIDGAVEVLPDSLADLLADDGRVVTGLAERGVTRLATARKANGKVIATALGDADFAILPDYAAPKAWSF
ncbi:protein-L-isoaspartate O-methyltransferase [Novosphingobium sp. SL115]|uniref:protein-L-isoaspartate O-methyltransferase family protein n=1 Tax=Novosphingobium sp. SL115 TaxID=2995150 RepID=UPI002276E629|nr:protein-L-isoaspartate O-methyltransferase [Novosphingobium sp. SL115]MCY1670266.1 protein-L-isoaspartate O-methyltransferase [Novosphingobium sp. SL115]